jgi:hypothetical protein
VDSKRNATYDNATSTTSSTLIDWSNGNLQTLVVATTTNITFTNHLAGNVYTLEAYNGIGGQPLITFPFLVSLPGGTGTSTVGKSDVGGTSGNQSGNYLVCTKAVATSTVGTATEFQWYIAGTIDTGTRSMGAIYSNNAGVPQTLLASTTAVNNAAGWVALPFNVPYALAQGVTYWLCMIEETAVAGHDLPVYDAGSAGDESYQSVGSFTIPSSYSETSTDTRKHSAYVSFQARPSLSLTSSTTNGDQIVFSCHNKITNHATTTCNATVSQNFAP